MPPEPLPWDRKDFFKERKHERSSESLGSVSRWRDTPHHGSSRWGSADFRRPFGRGKQGGWHMFSEESGHGFNLSRTNEKILDDESCRPSGSRGDGKYGRNSRENRGSLGQKVWKGHSWETPVSPNGLGRPPDVNDQRSVDNMVTYNSHPPPDFVNTWDQLHFKDQYDKNGAVNGLGTGQRFERENSLGSIDWKPLKWTRSGSLSSRGSGFSHSSSSKSIGVDSNEMKAEIQPRSVTPVQSPSGDAAACVTSAAPAEEMSLRKKPRLGWGEGLAKYEKKKVEGPDDNVAKSGTVFSGGNMEPMHSHASTLADKSPRVACFSGCASPATPSSVACSSSPGLEDKQFVKAANVDNDVSNPSGSPGLGSLNHSEGFAFNLENLELTSIANLSSSISDLLQSDDPSSVDTGFVRSTAMNKLLVWKGEALRALEMTESEIDMLENELKSLISESGSTCPCPAASSSLPVECHATPCEELGAVSNLIPRPSPLQLDSSGDMILQGTLNGLEEQHTGVKDEDIDSPGTATSKFVEPVSFGNSVFLSDTVKHECSGSSDIDASKNLEAKCSVCDLNEEKTGVVSACAEGSKLVVSNSCATLPTDCSSHCDREDILYDLILASNKDSANRASEVFNKLLPTNQCRVDISRAASIAGLQNDHLIMKKFAMRKRFLRFKERVITLKFRAFQHLWKEDLRLLSIRKYRAKSQKKCDSSLRIVQGGYQKNRSSIRSRFSSPAGNLSLVPTTEIINFTSKLLSDSQVKLYRSALKMPALILDKEKMVSRFISKNSLVEDPCAVEKERTMVNPWTSEEKENFLDKLATFGKDFRKIASFLDHKTTADCVEFYYKNHKSECFKKTKKKPEFAKQGKAYSTNTTYLVTSGNRWNREMNAASLDMLGAASAIASNVADGVESQHKCTSRYFYGVSNDHKAPRGDDGILERSSSHDMFGSEKETVAADVLAGICGSLSSEAMSSCITSSVDPGESYQEWKCQKVGSSMRRPLTPEVTQNVDDETCSDESCGEMDPTDWTDEEKSIFIQAVSSYGKDFTMISRCVRTRSRDQCRVFFSKARKCLGLDVIGLGPQNEGRPVSDDANGGGSDGEDACIVETGSVICRDKSGFKMDEDLPLSDLKVNHDQFDPLGTMILQPGLNRSEENSATGKPDFKDTEHGSEILVPDGRQTVDKPELKFDGDSNIGNGVSSECVAVQGHENAAMPSDSEAGGAKAIIQGTLDESISVVETNDHSLPTNISGAGVETRAVGEVSPEHSRAESEGQELLLPKSSILNDKHVESGDVNASGMSDLNCPIQNSKSVPLSAGNASHIAADANSSSGFGVISGYQNKTELESDSAKKLYVNLLQKDNCFVTSNSAPQDSTASQYEKTLIQDTASTRDFEKISDKRFQKSASADDHDLSGCSLLDHVESSQVLRGYPLPVSAKEVIGDISCKKAASSNISKSDRNFHSDGSLVENCYLQKCNSSKHHGSVVELPFLSQEQTGDHTRPPSSDVEKQCRNGKVKLFGQILTHPSSQRKPNSGTHGSEDKGTQNPKLSGQSFNLRFSGDRSVDGNSNLAKFDHNNYLGLENLPMMSYGFWDGNRIQTGFPSLPDSAVLLAKYPAAFGNYPTASSKVEQQPLHAAAVRSNERNLNGGVSVFPTREISSSNGVAAYQVYRSRDSTKVQPFTVDLKQRQEVLASEMQQRRNGFEAVSNVQQQATRGMVGINVVGRGGILVGAPCGGVSDPVAAIKMHYAKAEQYSGQAGSIIREEDSWRGKGKIGR